MNLITRRLAAVIECEYSWHFDYMYSFTLKVESILFSIGINPYSLDGANIGVFTSSGLSERDGGIIVNLKKFLYVLGTAKTMGPNRLSYTLNLKGNRTVHSHTTYL